MQKIKNFIKTFKKENFNIFFDKYFKMSIFEIAIAGILCSLWIVSSKFISINFGIMRVGIVYIWAIIVGLIFKPTIGILISIIADNISLAIGDGFGMWMIEYAIIYPFITLFASLFKYLFIIKNKKIWWSIISIINGIALIGGIVFAIIKNDFIKYSRNKDSNFDFTNQTSKIIIWVCISLVIIMISILIALNIKNKKYKIYLEIFTLVSATIIIFIWIWGPIAQVKYLIRLSGNQKNGESYWNLYDVYLTARVLKTPLIIPVYTIIIVAVYKSFLTINISNAKANKWIN